MGNVQQSCSICASRPEIRAALNAALGRGEKLRDVAKQSGFSKSALSRHARKCIPDATLVSHAAKKRAVAGARVITRWPGGKMFLLNDPAQPRGDTSRELPNITAADLQPSDIVLHITYESHRTNIRNPAALFDEALAEDAIRFPRTTETAAPIGR